ncbi:MAG: hypothetical protein Q9212_004194 [Teloschistes hypoglaucus]
MSIDNRGHWHERLVEGHNDAFVQSSRRIDAPMQPKPRPFNEKRMRTRSRPSSTVLVHSEKAGDPYYIGDIYDHSRIRQEYEKHETLSTKAPYLDHIDRLTDNGWSHLRYLADFMRVTTSPPLWRFLSQAESTERASRIKAAMLVIYSHTTERHDVTDLEHLKQLLRIEDEPRKGVIARLFIVEDLSRDLIEILGSHLDVDPTFFRGHISDYTWYNTRDPWIEVPDMNILTRQRSHFNIRYAQIRYFRTSRSFKKARAESTMFNVLRRVDRDGNRDTKEDAYLPDIGVVRSKMSFWVGLRKRQPSDPLIGILLVDPPIKEGFPLWGGYNSLAPCPSMADDSVIPRPVSRSVFEETIHWIEEMSREEVLSIPRDPRAMFLKPLSIVCSEWILLVRYANTRFSQLEWEVEDPRLRHRNQGLGLTLERLHTWRRRFPIYISIVTGILDDIIRREKFPGSTDNILQSLEKDFQLLLSDLDELHNRAERMMSVVTAVLSIEESQKALEQNRSLGRLTYLAALFVPLSFISSFFSMSEDVTKLSKTFWIYFAILA